MTATPTRHQHAELVAAERTDAVVKLLHAISCMRRAMDRVGTRSCAYDLLDSANALEAALPPVRLGLRARHTGDLPLHERVELSILYRAASRTGDLGSAGACVVPPSREDTLLLIADLDAWLRCAHGLVELLDVADEQQAA
jgi:hypothetical protein